MSTDILPFHFEAQQVRVIDIDGAPWFVLKDLTAILNIKQFRADRLDDDMISNHPIVDSLGRTQEARVVNEAGMYEVIIRSDSPAAKPFRRWVTSEVLPSIRKTGSYSTPERLRQLEHQTNATIRQSQMRMELLQTAKGLIHKDHLEAKARVVMAQGLGEAPQLDPARAPLYTQDFLREKNLSAKKLRSISGTFGKRVKAAYILEHGEDPKKYHLNLANGQTRAVNAYTEADRPLMETVFKKHYAAPEKEITA